MKVNISSEIVSKILERKENIEYILGEICGYLDHKYCRKINFEFKLEGEKKEIEISDSLANEVKLNFNNEKIDVIVEFLLFSYLCMGVTM